MGNKQWLIDASALEAWIDGGIQGAEEANGNAPKVNLYDVLSELYSIPAVDAVPVVHGRWENVTGGTVMLGDSSECKVRQPVIGTNYCKNCGAKMDGE